MNFFYEAVDGAGQTVLGKIDAASEPEARKRLLDMGYRPQSVAHNPAPQSAGLGDSITMMGSLNTMQVAGRSTSPPYPQTGLANSSTSPAGGLVSRSVEARPATQSFYPEYPIRTPQPVAAPAIAPRSEQAGVKPADLLLFFQMLAPLVKSGMTIYAALENVGSRSRHKVLAEIAKEASRHTRAGGRLSDTMACYPRIFSENIVGTVRAGELGGFLEIVLAEIALNYEQNIALYRGTYLIKAWITQAVFALALAIPLFSSVLNSMDMAANIQLYIQREMIILPIFGLVFLLGLAAVKYIQRPEMRRWRDSMALKLPAFGDLQRQSALSAFVRMLRKLYHAGVGPIQAWEAAMNTADNTIIREKLQAVYTHVERGSTLADAFAATGLFADNVEQIIVTGQLAGEVVESLDQAANIYQDRVQRAHDDSRRMMWKMTRVTVLIIGGITLLWFVKSYFAGVFHFVDTNFD